MNQINPVFAKYGGCCVLPEKVSIMNGASFPVPKGDNAILLFIEAAEGGEVTVHAGDSVLAGGDKKYLINTGKAVILVESGRHLFTKGDYKGQIRVSTRGEEMYAWVVELEG